jgi:hypothetical protein
MREDAWVGYLDIDECRFDCKLHLVLYRRREGLRECLQQLVVEPARSPTAAIHLRLRPPPSSNGRASERASE